MTLCPPGYADIRCFGQSAPTFRAGAEAVVVGPPDVRVTNALTGIAGLRLRATACPDQVRALSDLRADAALVLLTAEPLTGVRALRRACSTLHRIVVVAPPEAAEQVVAALRAGATSFLVSNDFSDDELVDAALAGSSRLSPLAVQAIVDGERTPVAPAVEVDLGERDRAILDLVAAGMTNAEIGRSLYLAEKTVRNNLSAIYEKLQVRGRPQAIVRWLGAEGGPRCRG